MRSRLACRLVSVVDSNVKLPTLAQANTRDVLGRCVYVVNELVLGDRMSDVFGRGVVFLGVMFLDGLDRLRRYCGRGSESGGADADAGKRRRERARGQEGG